MNPSVRIQIPAWIDDMAEQYRPDTTPEIQMDFVLDLVHRNISEGGGPFAAAIFDDAGSLVAAGVNRVVPDSAPIAHAEIVTIARAGQTLETWDLGSVGSFRLVTSTEPCAMCLGAVPWSGVRSVVIGAADADARAAGFDEGHKPADWVANLNSLGIDVVQDVRRDRAKRLFADYLQSGGQIYNGGRNA